MPRRRSNLGRRTSATERARQRRAQIRAEQAAQRRAESCLENAPLRAPRSRSVPSDLLPSQQNERARLRMAARRQRLRVQQSHDYNPLAFERKLIRKRKSATTCATSPKRGLLASSDEILEGDDIPGQSTSADRTLFKSKEIQSKDENIQLQPFKTSNSSKNAPRIGTRKSSSKRNIQQNQSTDYMDDEFDIFAKDIAFQLRQLPYYNALQCQEKIKRIINQERFIVQQFRHQEIETIIIKKEPGFNEEEPLQPVSSQETIQTIIKEEPLISEDEYPHPVSGYGTIYNENPDISEEEHSHTVSGQGTIQTIIKEDSVLSPALPSSSSSVSEVSSFNPPGDAPDSCNFLTPHRRHPPSNTSVMDPLDATLLLGISAAFLVLKRRKSNSKYS